MEDYWVFFCYIYGGNFVIVIKVEKVFFSVVKGLRKGVWIFSLLGIIDMKLSLRSFNLDFILIGKDVIRRGCIG